MLQECFRLRSDCDIVGETVDLIFTTWYAGQLSNDIVRGDWPNETRKRRTYDEISADCVRAVFCERFKSDKPLWFQKPIGFPSCVDFISMWGKDMPKFYAWYWQSFDTIFPQAKCFTILRSPFDVMISAKSYWNRDFGKVAKELMVMSELISHKESAVKFAVSYDNLIANPEQELRRLCSFLEIEFEPGMLAALSTKLVPSTKRLEIRHEDIRSELPTGFVSALSSMWARFEMPLEMEGTS